MSTLLKQVAEPQVQYTKKRRPYPKNRQRHPERSEICDCGNPKERRALRCRACKTKEGKTPEITAIFFVEGKPCRHISLTRGQYAIVDDCEFDRISAMSFFAKWIPTRNLFVVLTTVDPVDKTYVRGGVPLANHILGLRHGFIVDHVNRNPLDNRFSNLRPATKRQNVINCDVRSNSASGYKGVYHSSANRWTAYLRSEGILYNFGRFKSPELAAKNRDMEAVRYFGDFAVLNFPDMIDEYHAILSKKGQ